MEIYISKLILFLRLQCNLLYHQEFVNFLLYEGIYFKFIKFSIKNKISDNNKIKSNFVLKFYYVITKILKIVQTISSF